jgi:hypothetical protein
MPRRPSRRDGRRLWIMIVDDKATLQVTRASKGNIQQQARRIGSGKLWCSRQVQHRPEGFLDIPILRTGKQ